MGQLEERKLKKIQISLSKANIAKKISSTFKTAYKKLDKRSSLKDDFEKHRSSNTNTNLRKFPSHSKNKTELKKIVIPEASSGCIHHLGYLAERDSKIAIPDECMICKDLLECMHDSLGK